MCNKNFLSPSVPVIRNSGLGKWEVCVCEGRDMPRDAPTCQVDSEVGRCDKAICLGVVIKVEWDLSHPPSSIAARLWRQFCWWDSFNCLDFSGSFVVLEN
ncbi:hypothetical protein TNCV_4653671 [Trichonephila clavipes]|nr:hypothetical protein TNCV_4653671 [Trichonephila clavipes]